MNMTPSQPLPTDHDTRAPIDALLALVSHVDGILRVAEGLLQARRALRLDGLDRHIGRICASALDLSAEQRREAREQLVLLAIALDRVRDHLVPE